jgi:hypothetical protein
MPPTLRRLFLVAAIAAGATTAHAAPFDLASRDWEGCAELVDLARGELGRAHVVPTGKIDFKELRREDGLILLHPEKSLDAEGLAKFMRAGGRVVLLDDFGTGEQLLRHFGMERVSLPARPVEALRNNPHFAIAEPASQHPVVIDVTRVVTNHATGLRHPELSPVLKVRGVGEPDVPVAVAGAVGQGRLLVVGDPSIVMNSMLRYQGNKSFARGLLRYAADDDAWGKRGGRVFIATGSFESTGSFGDSDSILPSEWADKLRGLRDMLDTLRKEGASPAAAYAIAVLVGLGLVLWVGSRAGKLHKRAKPRFTRGTPLVAQGGVAGHAAVIAAPHTSRVLAMLELKSALEEDLCAVLGLEQQPGTEALLQKIAQERVLDDEGLRTLKRLMLRMASVETMVLSQRDAPPGNVWPKGGIQPVRDREIVAAARAVRRLLADAHARREGRRDAAGGIAS